MIWLQRHLNLLLILNVVIVLTIILIWVYFNRPVQDSDPTTTAPTPVPTLQRRIQTFAVGENLQDLGLSTDRQTLYVIDRSGTLYVLNAQTLVEQTHIGLLSIDQTPIYPQNIFISPLKPEMYLTTKKGQIMRVSLQNFQIHAQVQVNGQPTRMIIDRTGQYLFAANPSSNTVQVIELTDFKILKSIQVNQYPNSLLVDSKNEFLYVASQKSGHVSIISIDNLSMVGSILAGGQLQKIDFAPEQTSLLALSADQFIEIDLATRQVLNRLSIVSEAIEMTWEQSNKSWYILSAGQNGIGILDWSKKQSTGFIPLGSAFERGTGLTRIISINNQLIILDNANDRLYLVK